ncbi:FecR family protein [Chitinophaga arvensicola]|uniref:FecR family protein n=1 Tax=Chitinophaga arvensicola TaxID=29529 RepID=UPI0015A58550|nr:FecR family protein [Chitinophaga arvensicola]
MQKLQGTLDSAAATELEQWLSAQSAENRAFYTSMTSWTEIEEALHQFYQIDETAAWNDVWQRIGQESPKTSPAIRPIWIRRTAAAAAVLLLVGLGTGWWLHRKTVINSTIPPMASLGDTNVVPGGNKATLQLADGSVIVLDSAANGALSQQGNTLVRKEKEGALSYESLSPRPDTALVYNKVSTPRGGQYQVVLPDGTKVWLNAASSLRYPTAFNGNERSVELTGEAYFEVAANATKHFKVTVASSQHTPMQLEVLGTSFNIQAYGDEPVQAATLVTGKVNVVAGDQQALLIPGHEALLTRHSNRMQVQAADLDATLAWKNGLFYLQDANITDIMRQIARWYDVDVVYEGAIPQQFVGKIPRSMNLPDVLKILESTGWVHFRVEGKKITVQP